jgi:hypothetical protein
MSESFFKRIFLLSLAFLCSVTVFGYGVAVGMFQIWPYETIRSGWQVTENLVVYGELVPSGRAMAAPAGASRKAFTIHDHNRINEGYYVFTGWDSHIEGYAAWFYDLSGRLLHTWRIDYLALDPDGPLNGSGTPHAFQFLEDSSIIVGFDKGDVMVRLNECSEPMWKKDGIYHHSMSRADNGSFWVWRGEGTPYGHYNYMENFDADTGEKIREFGLIEDIIENMGPSSVIFGVRPDYPFRHFERTPKDKSTDLFHPNDIDVLTSDLAPLFPLFKTGDLLLSFRNLNMVAVFDPDDRRMKWWNHGPWISQHDPDFTKDGKISVYSNNPKRGRSEIIKIDPETRTISNALFYGEPFTSRAMGKHQYLPNGNVLIVVPGEGRVLELNSEGGKVLEFNNLSSIGPEFNDHVENGIWVPMDYLQGIPQCSE